MADLIIKPNAATGNKLILQDQAGGAVVTTADSGATITSATLTSPTLVTPALGTPTQGVVTNLSGALPVGVTGGSGLNAVPAKSGQVLNVRREWKPSDTGVWGVHGTSQGRDWTSFWAPTYTTTSSVTCKVFATVEMFIKVWAHQVTKNHLNFRYDISGAQVTAGSGNDMNGETFMGEWNNASSSYWSYPGGRFTLPLREVTCSATNAAITFNLECQNENASNGNCGWVMYGDGNTDETSICFVEVKA